MKKFDLNIEKVLEDWEIFHALREIIANALDETTLAGCPDMEIFRDAHDDWHIRDYGRGIKYQHLTQKENEEKLSSPHLIGKFGVGLKDALATFDRRGVGVRIYSKHGDISLKRSAKHGFDDIVTLHAVVMPATHPRMQGTDFVLSGCTEEDIEQAKRMFLKFSGEPLLEKTDHGEVLQKHEDTAVIYINGVKVAEEENFLFSYNITALSAAIKKALNRERTNVGRTAYSDRVKAILLACRNTAVADKIVGELSNFQKGLLKDELKWTDVYVHACKLLNASQKVIFLTPNERGYAAGIITHARRDGIRVVTIPENIRQKLKGEVDYSGNRIRDLHEYVREWNESFEFKFVPPSKLTAQELAIFNQAEEIFEAIGGKPEQIKALRISETMRMSGPGGYEVVGVWEPDLGRIVIKRSQLESLSEFAGTLLHETAHALTDAPDVSEAFEIGLTQVLGQSASSAVRRKQPRSKGQVKASKKLGKAAANRRKH